MAELNIASGIKNTLAFSEGFLQTKHVDVDVDVDVDVEVQPLHAEPVARPVEENTLFNRWLSASPL